jgi:hypothetical protein
VFANDVLYIGKGGGLVTYAGNLDDTATYDVRYFSHPLDWGNTTNLKFLKKFNVTVIGGAGATAVLNWAYDYSQNFSKQEFSFEEVLNEGVYGVGQFNINEYSSGVTVQTPKVNTTGSGTEVTVGVETTINGSPFSIQKIDIHALLGRFI